MKIYLYLAGIYIHIPFCRKACHYCDFHFSTGLDGKNGFIDALLKEIAITPLYSDQPAIETIYFGGGTPSLLLAKELQQILHALKEKFRISPTAEITLESNPDDIRPHLLLQWLNLGINRLSIGVQSFHDADLIWMNRAHDAGQAARSIEWTKEAGFDNFSIDLIYGRPGLDDEAWKKNVDRLIKLETPHISCYALTVEPKTALHTMIQKKQRLDIDPGQQEQQFLLLVQWLEAAGYGHYEISNFALPGKESRHNGAYWTGRRYYGFGPSAHSYDGYNRRWNIANNEQYRQSLVNGVIPSATEVLTTQQRLNEYVMLSLRTARGIDLQFIASNFGYDERERILRVGEKFLAAGKMEQHQDFLRLTLAGKLFADGIASALFT